MRYFLDRLDVSDPASPRLLRPINIPGELAYFDAPDADFDDLHVALGLALFQITREYSLIEGLVYAWGAGAGLTLALVLMAGLREEAELSDIPSVMRGTAMNLIIAGILSLAFMGFAGLFSAG